jgi:formylglycine-generating enzyme required for sulfatase activity
LYFLLTGKSPRAMRERELPEAWRELVFRMAESASEGRYADLRAVRAEVQGLIHEAQRSPAPAPGPAVIVPATPAISRSSRPATPLVHAKTTVAGDVSSWAEVLKASVDRSIVTDAFLAEQITSVALPWRVCDRVTGIEMVLIPPGKYMRGALPGDDEANEDERPSHEVTVTKPFYLGVYPVTQRQWTKAVSSDPSEFKGQDLPVETVSWTDVDQYLQAAKGLRLLTEAEWEYACRAGSSRARYGELNDIAWHAGNSRGSTHPVGGQRSNSFGLHDMLGNVMEWCSDWYGAYPRGHLVDPTGPASGSNRICRGGAWGYSGKSCRASSRLGVSPSSRGRLLGFRVVRAT